MCWKRRGIEVTSGFKNSSSDVVQGCDKRRRHVRENQCYFFAPLGSHQRVTIEVVESPVSTTLTRFSRRRSRITDLRGHTY